MNDELIVSSDVLESYSIPLDVFILIELVIECTFISHLSINGPQYSHKIIKHEDGTNVKMKDHKAFVHYLVLFTDVVLILPKHRIKHRSQRVE